MDILELVQQELEAEYRTTVKFFELFPEEKVEYRPHPKSMTLGHLATHLSNIFSWAGIILQTAFLDQADGPVPEVIGTPRELLEATKKGYESSVQALSKASEANLHESWALKNEGKVLMEWDKYGAIRHSLNQITHHRAQLGVYYRLNEISLPGSYGPTADHPGG